MSETCQIHVAKKMVYGSTVEKSAVEGHGALEEWEIRVTMYNIIDGNDKVTASSSTFF